MGWYGLWNIEYTGKNKEKFVNTAKLVIANFKKRFEIVEDGNVLDSVKRLSWYSADMDIEKILSYLDDGDKIRVLIDGETHPYDDNDDELEYEDQTFKKQNGQVTMECQYTDCDRYQTGRHGMRGAFIYELSYPNEARRETTEGGYTDTLDTYIEWIASEMGDSEEMIPVIHDFINEIMNITREEVVKENGQMDEEAFAYFNSVKERFATLETTKEYLAEIREKLPPKEQEKVEVPDVFANMSTIDIRKLGGIEELIKLYEKVGEEKAAELLTILGYDLNGANKENQSSVKKKQALKVADEEMKQAVCEYMLGIIKEKYPDLSKENEEIFVRKIGRIAEKQIRGDFNGSWGISGLNCDNRPSGELLAAFCSMDFGPDWPEYRMDAAAHLAFPSKLAMPLERGRYLAVNKGYYRDTEYLYMTDEYRQEQLTSINTAIMRAEEKIPDKEKATWEEEYNTLIEALQIQRDSLMKKEEEIQAVIERKKALKDRAEQLIDSYASRIEELDSLGLPESEKKQRTQEIIEEIQEATKTANAYNESAEISKIGEKYGVSRGGLEWFDEEHKHDFDKEDWLRRRRIKYARDELGISLDEWYEKKDRIDEYDKRQEDIELDKREELDSQQTEFIKALSEAYLDYAKESGVIERKSRQRGNVERKF